MVENCSIIRQYIKTCCTVERQFYIVRLECLLLSKAYKLHNFILLLKYILYNKCACRLSQGYIILIKVNDIMFYYSFIFNYHFCILKVKAAACALKKKKEKAQITFFFTYLSHQVISKVLFFLFLHASRKKSKSKGQHKLHAKITWFP